MYNYFFPVVQPYEVAEWPIVFLAVYLALYDAGTDSVDGLPANCLSFYLLLHRQVLLHNRPKG